MIVLQNVFKSTNFFAIQIDNQSHLIVPVSDNNSKSVFILNVKNGEQLSVKENAINNYISCKNKTGLSITYPTPVLLAEIMATVIPNVDLSVN